MKISWANVCCGLFLSCLINSICFAQAAEPSDQPQKFSSLIEAYADQNDCNSAWEKLIAEWEFSGGGIKNSIKATRTQIEFDKKSKFAKIVRDVWSSQKNIVMAKIGGWPISDHQINDAVTSPNVKLAGQLKKYVPGKCVAFFWIDPFVLSDLQHKVNGDIFLRRLKETPSDMEWNSVSSIIWIKYWLFVRLK